MDSEKRIPPFILSILFILSKLFFRDLLMDCSPKGRLLELSCSLCPFVAITPGPKIINKNTCNRSKLCHISSRADTRCLT